MATKIFINNKAPSPDADWFNDADYLIYDTFDSPTAVGADGTIWVSNGTKFVEESGATARASLGAQAQDAQLDDLAALAVTDSNFIVGDGTNWVAETGDTARTSLGVGTGDSPQFTGIELGHATDTTLTRSSAGVLAVEGVVIGLTGKHTAWIPAASMRPTTSNGCSSITNFETTAGRPDFQVLYFDGAADEHAQFAIAFPKGWNEGTVTFRAVWGVTDTAATDGTDTVSWGLQGLGVADDASVDQVYGTGVVVTEATSGTVEDIAISAESTAVTIASAAVDTLTFFRVYRDVSEDDMTEDAGLIGIQIFYTIDAGNDA